MNPIDENVLRTEKRKKLTAMREAGINPFPYSFDNRTSVSEIVAKHAEGLQAGEKLLESNYRVAGRLMTVRLMGKAAFFNVQDQTGSL